MWVVVEHGKEIQLQVVGGVGHLRRQLGGGKAHRSALSRLLCGEDYHIAETGWGAGKKTSPDRKLNKPQLSAMDMCLWSDFSSPLFPNIAS
jgi:hypothetical protein